MSEGEECGTNGILCSIPNFAVLLGNLTAGHGFRVNDLRVVWKDLRLVYETFDLKWNRRIKTATIRVHTSYFCPMPCTQLCTHSTTGVTNEHNFGSRRWIRGSHTIVSYLDSFTSFFVFLLRKKQTLLARGVFFIQYSIFNAILYASRRD